jgi:hypothetical protein
MLLIYTHKLTPRLKYVFKQIFRGFLDIQVGFTTAVDEFIAHEGHKMSYTNKPLGAELFFQSNTILFEQGINDVEISVSEIEGVPVFFQVGPKSAMPFDIFGASFYLLSRYEEYLPHIRDEHNRFSAEDSLAFKNGFIKKPLVDIWVDQLYTVLDERFDFDEKREKKFRFESTIDVSKVYDYNSKGFTRGIVGLFIDLFSFKFSRVYERVVTILGLRKDPYDSFSLLLRLQKKHKMKMSYFFLLANYSRYDRNISYNKTGLHSLIKTVGDRSNIGLHPSYFSNSMPEKFKIEKERLEGVTNFRIKSSRQHYIKLQLPETYRFLIDIEIFEDYSMGYADNIGYRASTSEVFYFYDLDFEIQTPLKIHPFIVSDYAMKKSMNFTPKKALEEITELLEFAKATNSNFISLFHNDSLGRSDDWKGWRNVYIEMIRMVYDKE